MIDWSKLLIRTDRPDTAEMLELWEWLIGREMHPLVMSKFGDWFLTDPEGQVHWLNVVEGSCTQVADTVEDWQIQMMLEGPLDLWFLPQWCYRLHDEGHIPGEDQCYGFKLPPRLGAPFDLSNVEVMNLMAYQIISATIAKIPPGTKVDAFTINGSIP
jgi:hypothetical protein